MLTIKSIRMFLKKSCKEVAERNIAIVNRTNLKNFGSVLQVYALCQAVRKLGYGSEVVWQSGNMSINYDIRPNKIIKIALKLLFYPRLLFSTIKTIREVRSVTIEPETVRLFDEFVAGNFQQSFYAPGEIEAMAASDKYSKFVCGSDQVWATTTLYPDPMMYLRFAPREKRVAYAPSLGRNYIPNYNRKTIKRYVNGIDNVSVREDSGHQLLKELTGRDFPVVADPTLLMRSHEWDALKADIELPEHYVMCYFLDEPSQEVKDAICKYVRENDKKVVVLGHLEEIELSENDIIRPVAGPAEFLTITSQADMVITDSYHGMLFSINYHRKFWSVERDYSQYDQSSRQLTVLNRLHLEDRYIKNNYKFTEAPIDYEYVQARIDDFVNYSLNYLNNALMK